MRHLLVALAGLLLASVALASNLETVFSVALPYTEATILVDNTYLYQDVLFVVCGDGSMVEAVNLTTRTTMWVSPNLTAYGDIYSIAPTSQVTLLSFGNLLIALSTKTGQQIWIQNGYYLIAPAAAFLYGNTIYAQVALPTPTSYTALQAFDLATGTPGFFQYSSDLQIDGNTAFISQYNFDGEGFVFGSAIRAVDIPTNTTLWTVPCSTQRMLPVISAQYVAIANLSGTDEVAVVLHRKNGTVAQSFQAFNGLATFGVASIHGSTLFALVGLEIPRYVLADLTTGFITWTRSLAEVGSGAFFSGDALVSLSPSLVFTITPVGSNSPSISIPQVPTLPNPTIVDFGSGLVQVGNLQGYTMWDTNTGNFVGSNEQEPNALLTQPLKWNGLLVMVSGNVVTGVKVIA